MIRDLMDIASRSIVQRNKKFLNKHKGEECYLFGNGVSLRSFDLYKFSDKISFGCSLLMLHKNISDLNIKYYVEHHPLVFSKYWRGTKTGMHIEKNPLYDFFHANSAKYEMFVHAIDYFSTKQYSNFNYIHNFKKHDLSLDTLDFSKSSSFVKGGLYSMIGLAIYMGFKKIYLVGCDYWFSPMMYTHFYDFKDELSVDCEFIYTDLMSEIKDKIEVVVVTKNGSKSPVNYIEYSELTGSDEVKQTVPDIVSKEHFSLIHSIQYIR